MTSPFYSRTLLYNTLPSPSLPIQVVNAISIFGNDKIVYLQSKGCMPTANWPLQSFSCFYFVIVYTAGQYGNLTVQYSIVPPKDERCHHGVKLNRCRTNSANSLLDCVTRFAWSADTPSRSAAFNQGSL